MSMFEIFINLYVKLPVEFKKDTLKVPQAPKSLRRAQKAKFVRKEPQKVAKKSKNANV